MRKIFILTLVVMWFNLSAQNVVYNAKGNKINYKTEDMDIAFADSEVRIPGADQKIVPVLSALIPSVINLGFKIATKSLENKVKKYSGEYQIQKSYLNPSRNDVPVITFYRTLKMDGVQKDSTGIKVVLNPQQVRINENTMACTYDIESIVLHHSKARAKGSYMDYTIEVKPTFIVDGEKKAQELSPIIIPSVEFGTNKFTALKHRTDLILLPKGATLAEFSIKIIETNPAKIKTDKVLSLSNDYVEDAKTIINNFIPKAKE